MPGRHFALALLFLIAGTAAVVAAAPELAVGAFLSRRVVAATHLFTLGWITTSILGALYQLLPVVLERPVRWLGLARLTLCLHGAGIPLFVGGLWMGHGPATVAGAGLFATGLLLFAVNLGATLAGATERGVTWWALVLADLFLVVTVLLGTALAGNLRWDLLGGNRLLALGVHVHVALAGWVLLVVVGVGQRLLPMFLLSHGVDEGPARFAVASIGAGLLILVAFHHGPAVVGVWSPAVLVLMGVAAFLLQAGRFYRHRRRPALDPGMAIAAAGLVLVGAGAVLAPLVLTRGFGAGMLVTAYGALLVLGLSTFVAGHYFRIVPFLVWYHRFGPLVGRAKVPLVADLYDGRWAGAAGTLLGTGAAGTVAGILAGIPGVVTAGGALLAAGALLETAQMVRIARSRPAAVE